MWPVTPTFLNALQSPVHVIRIKAEVLDDNNVPVSGGTFHDANAATSAGFIQNFITDGSVDLDITRGTRRTFQMTLLNQDGQFSPGANWTGLFYVNRHFRIWRGIDYGGSVEYVPVGTFMIDEADVIVQDNMSLVNLSGSDFYKKLTKSMFTQPKTYAAGTPLNTIIRDMATTAGITSISLDPLATRSATAKQINTTLNYERGQYRGDELLSLLNTVGIEAYCDPLGTFVTRDFTNPAEFPSVLTVTGGNGGLLLNVKNVYKDDALYNHALVVATGATSAVYTAEKSDTDPRSPTNINAIGDRVFKFESSLLSTQAEANAAVTKVYYDNILLSQEADIEMICHPGIEGGDILRVTETAQSKLDADIRVTQLTVPLASSRMPVTLQRTVKLS